MACQLAAKKLAGARRGFRRAPLVTRQPAYKPGSGWHAGVPAYVTAIPLGRRLPGASSNLPERPDLDTIPKLFAFLREDFAPFLFGLAPGGVYLAGSVAGPAVRSYRTFSPLLPLPFGWGSGSFSVALSLGLPPPDVIRHRMSMEPGLSSPLSLSAIAGAAVRPTDAVRHGGSGRPRQADNSRAGA